MDADKNLAGKDETKTVALGRTRNRPIWGLWLSICVRAVHQFCVALMFGVLFLGEGEGTGSILWFAAGSGVLLCFTEGARHREMYREVSGVVTFGKCILLGGAVHGVLPELPTFCLVFFVASLAAHAPKHVRHRLLC